MEASSVESKAQSEFLGPREPRGHPPTPADKIWVFQCPGGREGRGKPKVALTRQETPKGVGGFGLPSKRKGSAGSQTASEDSPSRKKFPAIFPHICFSSYSVL